jgi:hypothetical protein
METAGTTVNEIVPRDFQNNGGSDPGLTRERELGGKDWRCQKQSILWRWNWVNYSSLSSLLAQAK